MRPAAHVESSHEDLFLRRYASLLAFAYSICGPDRYHAEDLVHDAFLAFTIGCPNLADIENLDGYLRGIVRKLHLSSVRRAARAGQTSLSLIDHDSVELGLRAVGAAGVEAAHELEHICRYACARKSSSKVGGILILRFFYGYFASEIGRIVRCSVGAVDEWLRMARREVKLFQSGSNRLRLLVEPPVCEAISLPPIDECGHPTEHLRAIQQAIAKTRTGRCLSEPELSRFYSASPAESMDTPSLAHVVSCPPCLDRINERLGLPALKDRFPNDMLGPNRGSSGGGASTGRGGAHFARARERRWRTVYEHRALELQIAVNGLIVGSHSVGRDITRQTVAVNIGEPIGCVEVFGERGVRLAFLDVVPQPEGAVEQSLSMTLSENRQLHVRISFARPWPEVSVEYEDPNQLEERVLHPEPAATTEDSSPSSTQPRPAWLDWIWQPERPRWKLAAALGCLVLCLLLAPTGTAAWAAERVSQALAAIERELTALSQRIWATPLVSRPLGPVTTAAPSVVPEGAVIRRRADEVAAVPTAQMLMHAEIKALTRLDGIDALVGGRIDVQRAARYIRIRGTVADAERKRAVLQALLPLREAGLVQVDVSSVADRLASEPVANGTVRYLPFTFHPGEMPAAGAMRAGLAATPEWADADPPRLDREVRRIATTVLNSALEARLHAAVLRSLADRYDGVPLEHLDRAAHDAWVTLMTRHANAVANSTRAYRELLEPLLRPLPVDPSGESAGRSREDTLATDESSTEIAALANTLDERLRGELSASTEAARDSGLREQSFWDSVRRLERLAAAITR